MKRFDYYKAAVCTPPVSIGNPKANVDDMLRILQSLDPDTQLAVFPELAVTGYTCADLFYEDILLKEAMTQLVRLAEQAPANMAVITGIPLKAGTRLFNAAAFLFDGEVLGFYVKHHLPGYNEYYEPRWFSPARDLDVSDVKVNGVDVPVSGKILFADETTDAVIGIEICEDLWVAVPPSSGHAQAGANILVNCSASNEVIAKNRYRRDLVSSQSAKTYSGYLYCSAGPDESSTDLVFSGADLMAENGKILAETASEEIGRAHV